MGPGDSAETQTKVTRTHSLLPPGRALGRHPGASPQPAALKGRGGGLHPVTRGMSPQGPGCWGCRRWWADTGPCGRPRPGCGEHSAGPHSPPEPGPHRRPCRSQPPHSQLLRGHKPLHETPENVPTCTQTPAIRRGAVAPPGSPSQSWLQTKCSCRARAMETEAWTSPSRAQTRPSWDQITGKESLRGVFKLSYPLLISLIHQIFEFNKLAASPFNEFYLSPDGTTWVQVS